VSLSDLTPQRPDIHQRVPLTSREQVTEFQDRDELRRHWNWLWRQRDLKLKSSRGRESIQLRYGRLPKAFQVLIDQRATYARFGSQNGFRRTAMSQYVGN
jgi:hypothetical protein